MARGNGSRNGITGLNRRCVLAAGAALSVPDIASASEANPVSSAGCMADAQKEWIAEPPQAPVRQGFAQLEDVRLWYWDTGGSGECVILLHPLTGNHAVWGFQQPVLAKAGYRVIGYSRRGFYQSEAGPSERVGTGAGDLQALVQFLGVSRFHFVGLAAGGFIGPDYAISYPDKLLSMTIASSQAGIVDEAYRKKLSALAPAGFASLAPEFREIGPSYRAANAQGVQRWIDLHRLNATGDMVRQPTINRLDWESVERIRIPTLVLTGDADMYMPPSMARELSSHFYRSRLSVLPEAGHSSYWEQPDQFNKSLLSFLKANRA